MGDRGWWAEDIRARRRSFEASRLAFEASKPATRRRSSFSSKDDVLEKRAPRSGAAAATMQRRHTDPEIGSTSRPKLNRKKSATLPKRQPPPAKAKLPPSPSPSPGSSVCVPLGDAWPVHQVSDTAVMAKLEEILLVQHKIEARLNAQSKSRCAVM